jgi:hypothetical protein
VFIEALLDKERTRYHAYPPYLFEEKPVKAWQCFDIYCDDGRGKTEVVRELAWELRIPRKRQLDWKTLFLPVCVCV